MNLAMDPYLVLILVGFLPSEVWRWLGIVLGRGLDEESEILLWVRGVATALVAGAMLAFALSFDEVIVTTFTAGQRQTLPIWMFSQLTRPRQRPVTNVVAVFVVAVTAVPILLAHRFTSERR